jgi:hypothetical protein
MEDEERDKYCHGCLVGYNSDVYCSPRERGFEKNCPCVNCLIKPICDQPCEKYDLFLFIVNAELRIKAKRRKVK